MTHESKRIADMLRYCSRETDGSGCGECPAHAGEDCHNTLFARAADLIESLAAERDEWKLRAEAAERDLAYCYPCEVCMHGPDCGKYPLYCINGNAFMWRGPCKENGGVE